MSNMDWQTSDGVTLKSLRQSAGIGLSVLARKASLSVDQLRQLEDGGSSLFYTEAIKLRAGERALSILGFRFTEPQVQVHEQALGHPVQRIVPLQSPKPPLGLRLARMGEYVEAKFKGQFAVLARVLRVFRVFRGAGGVGGVGGSVVLRSVWHSKFLWILMGIMATGLLAYDLSQRSAQLGLQSAQLTTWLRDALVNPKPSPVANSVLLASSGSAGVQSSQFEAAQALDTQPKVSQNTKASSPVDVSTSPAAPGAPTAAVAEQQNTSSCHWQSESPSLTALHPSKQGNFVHIMATAPTNLCVMDVQNKVSVIALAAGASQSVYGVAPFKVYSENIRQLKFYFQGYRIYVPQDVVNQFTLSELPVIKEASVAQSLY